MTMQKLRSVHRKTSKLSRQTKIMRAYVSWVLNLQAVQHSLRSSRALSGALWKFCFFGFKSIFTDSPSTTGSSVPAAMIRCRIPVRHMESFAGCLAQWKKLFFCGSCLPCRSCQLWWRSLNWSSWRTNAAFAIRAVCWKWWAVSSGGWLESISDTAYSIVFFTDSLVYIWW